MIDRQVRPRGRVLEGHGDEGGDEIDDTGRPKKLRHKEWFDPAEEPFTVEREAYAPLVWQCRYSGIEVPDALWRSCTTGKNLPYSGGRTGTSQKAIAGPTSS